MVHRAQATTPSVTANMSLLSVAPEILLNIADHLLSNLCDLLSLTLTNHYFHSLLHRQLISTGPPMRILVWGITHDHPSSISLALSHGANPDALYTPIPDELPDLDDDPRAPLEIAFFRRMFAEDKGPSGQTLALLYGGGATPTKDALIAAVWDGDLEMIRMLAEHGHDLNKRYEEGHVALCAALEVQHPSQIETIRLMLELGAKADGGDETWEGRPLLWRLKMKDHGVKVEAVKVLLEAGANVTTMVDVPDRGRMGIVEYVGRDEGMGQMYELLAEFGANRV